RGIVAAITAGRSRMFRTVSRVAVAALLLLVPVTAASQGTAPELDRQQRATLLQLVTAVTTDSPVDSTPNADWPVHLFRTSDGSHYVACSVPMPAGVDESAPLALYVRLAPRTGPDLSASLPRSAVHEWLLGERSDPLPLNPRRVVQVPTGEMPAGGLAATFLRDGGAGQASAALRLMDLQR